VNRFVLGGLTGAVLVGLVLVAVLSLAGLQISDEDVKVPSLLGDPSQDHVIRQLPESGQLMRSGGTVTLFAG
jgi:beta-lactam-binding protein with PASTA domain